MIAESVIKNKFIDIKPFGKEFFKGIKKEVTQECSSRGSALGRKFYALYKSLDMDAFVDNLFSEVIEKGEEEIGDWLLSKWVVKQSDLFQYFHQKLSAITEDYDQLTGLAPEVEEEMKKELFAEFSAVDIYLFSVLNSVVFSKQCLQELKQSAEQEQREKQETSPISLSIEELQASFAQEKQKLLEKQERRLLGMAERQKKEVEGYRKQIAKLQKKLEEASGRCG